MARRRKTNPAPHPEPDADANTTAEALRPLGRRDALIAAGIALVTAAVFARTIFYDFVNFDDIAHIVENPYVIHGLTWESVSWAFTTGYVGDFNPLTWLSHIVDGQLWGLNPLGHHLTNVALHALGAALLFVALRMMTGAVWASAFAAALFALHPLRVESVAWVTERKDVLCGVFWMLSLIAYARYVRRPRSNGRYALLLLAAAGALLAKPIAIALPFALLPLDYWPLERTPLNRRNGAPPRVSWPRLFVEKSPLFAGAVTVAIASFVATRDVGAISETPVDFFGRRVGNAIVSYARYLGMTVWPTGLIPLYPLPRDGWPLTLILPSLFFLLAITVVCHWQWRRRPWLIVGWLWFGGVLLPVIGVVQAGRQALADRYMYLPSIGLALVVTWVGREAVARGWLDRRVAASLACVALLALAVLSWRQSGHWRNSETLFAHTLAVDPDNLTGLNNLCGHLIERGRLDEAGALADRVLALRPASAIANHNKGHLLSKAGDRDGAIAHYRRALRTNPDAAATLHNLGYALQKQGRVDEAVALYEKSLSIYPNSAECRLDLSKAFRRQGEIEAAKTELIEALRINPGYALAYSNLGVIARQQGDRPEAIRLYRKALSLDPGCAEAHNNLANVLLKQRQVEKAVRHFEQALAIQPEQPTFWVNTGWACYQAGRVDEAIEMYARAVAINPNYHIHAARFGRTLERAGRRDAAMRLYETLLNDLDPAGQAARTLKRRLQALERRDAAARNENAQESMP